MPRITPNRLAAACALALVLSLTLVSGASAKAFSAKLRVVGANGKLLTEKTVSTADTTLKSSPEATCFGKGSGGSGEPVTIKGTTAMGLLAHASLTTSTLKPLTISDHFSFALALCGVGQSVAGGSSSWYLKIDHKSQSVGGDTAKIHAGDEVLWALAKTEAPSYEYPNELVLSAPRSAKSGVAFKVKALSYDEKGRSKPASGVRVNGASAPTGSDGTTMVTLRAPKLLSASKSGEIPSARVSVCVGGKCLKAK
jgi:hypothetical protein